MKIPARFLVLSSCFFLSGLAGLIYETAWIQQFALVFGTSELALAAVLSAYMAGLALGAAAAGRWARQVRRPVLAYALLELGIAAAALAVPVAVDAASRLHVALLGATELPSEAGSPGTAAFYLASSFAILLVPTALMGATLPLLARHAVRRDAEIGRRIGALYTANTAGAAAGTLTAAFLLLPTFGLGRTVLVGAAVNLLVFVLAAGLARRSDLPAVEPAPRTAAECRWILPLVLISGGVSFTYEIFWTRILTLLLGGSVYAFATMLATFLTGIALGSALAARLATSSERARHGFAVAQVAAAILSLAAFVAVDRLPALFQALAAAGVGSPAGGTVICALTLLPGAVAFGATFPFAVRVLVRDAADAASASARVFAWNTAGAILGSLAAGFVVLPALRFAGTATAAAGTGLVLAAFAALAARPRLRWTAAIAVLGLLSLTVVQPSTPWTLLRHGPLGAREVQGEVVHYGVGRSATVLLFDQRDQWRLFSNGLPESGIQPPWGRAGGYVITRWLSLLPLAARPESRSLLVVGLGAGVTVEDVPRTVEKIHVIELEPEVVRANRRVADERRKDPLADPRLSLHLGDARGALRLTRRSFDVVVSQPSHPWTAGASHLFTREFFSLVRERLSPSGVFVQWMGLSFVDRELMRSLVATLADVFPYLEVYHPAPGAVLFLASANPLDVEATASKAIAAARSEWAEVGVTVGEDVVAARVLDAEGARRLARDAEISTDFRNLLRTRSPKVLGNPLGAVGADQLLAPFDPLRPSTARDGLYLVRRLLRANFTGRAERLARTFDDEVARQTALGLIHTAAGRRRRAERALRQALALDAADPEARSALLRLFRQQIAEGQAVPLVDRLVAQDEAETALIEGWRRMTAGDWAAARGLEERLAAIGPRHPLFMDATRLRVRWRLGNGEGDSAREALELLTPLLAPVPLPEDLLLRAEVAVAAGKPRTALATLSEALTKTGRQQAWVGKVRPGPLRPRSCPTPAGLKDMGLLDPGRCPGLLDPTPLGFRKACPLEGRGGTTALLRPQGQTELRLRTPTKDAGIPSMASGFVRGLPGLPLRSVGPGRGEFPAGRPLPGMRFRLPTARRPGPGLLGARERGPAARGNVPKSPGPPRGRDLGLPPKPAERPRPLRQRSGSLPSQSWHASLVCRGSGRRHRRRLRGAGTDRPDPV